MHKAFLTVILIFCSLCSQLIIGARPSLEVVTNQSETHVNFDNLIIRRWKPQVRVTYDYYPFGLTWENPKLPGTEEGLHDHTYQDKEYQFAEFSDGRGLELHDFHARMYDATTGRWLVPDPAAQFANPYLAMGNNPVISVDPDGRFAHILIGAGVGGIINWIAHGAHFDQEGLEAFAIGALAGGLTAATGGAATALVGGAGAGGFAGGAVIGAFSATAGNVVLSEGNHLFLGDPRWSDGQYLIGAGMGALFGGVANGMTAKGQGNSFWTGASPSSNYSGGYVGSGKRIAHKGSGVVQSKQKEAWRFYEAPFSDETLEKWNQLYREMLAEGYFIDDNGFITRGPLRPIGVEIIANRTNVNVYFGKNSSQIYHTFRHADALGIDRATLQSTILDDFLPISSQVIPGEPFNRIIQVGGINLQYTAFMRPDGFNIGRINAIP